MIENISIEGLITIIISIIAVSIIVPINITLYMLNKRDDEIRCLKDKISALETECASFKYSHKLIVDNLKLDMFKEEK